jgi:hypothetical protein
MHLVSSQVTALAWIRACPRRFRRRPHGTTSRRLSHATDARLAPASAKRQQRRLRPRVGARALQVERWRGGKGGSTWWRCPHDGPDLRLAPRSALPGGLPSCAVIGPWGGRARSRAAAVAQLPRVACHTNRAVGTVGVPGGAAEACQRSVIGRQFACVSVQASARSSYEASTPRRSSRAVAAIVLDAHGRTAGIVPSRTCSRRSSGRSRAGTTSPTSRSGGSTIAPLLTFDRLGRMAKIGDE